MQEMVISFLHPPGQPCSLSPLQRKRLTELRKALDDFDEDTRQRGLTYASQNRVKELSIDDDEVRAEVQGTETYEMHWDYEDGLWFSDCTCPVEFYCKHAFAVAHLVLLQEEAPAPAKPAKTWKTSSFKDEITRRTGSRLTKSDQKIADHIERVHREVQRRSVRFLGVPDLRPLELPVPKSDNSWEAPRAMIDWWDSPPASALDLWQYIALYAERTGAKIPVFLQPLTDTSAIRAGVEAKLHDKEVAHWKTVLTDFARQESSTPAARPLRLRLALPKIYWEEEAGAGVWQRISADRVRELAARPQAQLDGTSMVLLTLAGRHARAGYWTRSNYALNMDREEDTFFLNAALSNSVTRSRVVRHDGEAFDFVEDSLRWEFRPSARDPKGEIEASLVTSDGTAVRERPGIFPGSKPLLLIQGRLHKAPPPLHKKGNPYASAFLPREALTEAPEAVAALKKGGAVFPGDIEATFQTVSLFPCLICEVYSPEFGYTEELRIRLLARSTEYNLEKAWCGPDGWQFLDSTSKSRVGPDGQVLLFDTSAADDTVPILAALRLGYASHLKYWVRGVTKSFPAEFAEWARALPPGIEIRASPALRAFFEPAAAATLRFEIEERPDAPDWFDLRTELGVNDVELTPEEIQALLKARGGFVRLKSGAWERLEARFSEEDAAALDAMGLNMESALSDERHSFHALQLAGSSITRLAGEKIHEQIAARAGAIRAIVPPEPPAGFLGTLRPYQREGFHFLAFLSTNNFGGVLADDMGLGKTIQALAWLLWLRRQAKAGGFRALIVCPKSVMHNWAAETARFTPDLAALPFTPGVKIAKKSATLLIANYTQLRLNAPWFVGQKWDAVILDEGQNIKNPASQSARTARELTTRHRIVLTGTPIENRAMDLWSLCAFVQPGLLGSQASFKRLYESGAADGLSRLQARVRHFLLRRTKAQVAPELPPRTEEDLHCELDGEQAALYQAELKKTRRIVLGLSTKTSFDQARFNILQSLLRLRQICCDPRLITKSREKSAPSAKMEALFDQLRPLVQEGHKILVFSQFVEMLSLISDELTRESIPHLTLTGQSENRQELVNKFQSDPAIPVFLLSLKAAGTGLNLTAASYVILYDPWWNPAVEAQAIDRTHRIGQIKPVIAYRLLAKDTIEEKIRALQKQKSAVADAVIHEESLAKVLDLDSLRFLLAE